MGTSPIRPSRESWRTLPALPGAQAAQLDVNGLALGDASSVCLVEAATGRAYWVARSRGIPAALGIVGSRLYTLTTGGVLTSRFLDKGSADWRVRLKDRAALASAGGTSIIRSGDVVVANLRGQVVGVHVRTHRVAWRTPLAAPGPPIAHASFIYAIVANQLVALDASSGRVAWKRNIPSGAAPAMSTSGRAVVVFASHSVRGLDLASGHQAWEVPDEESGPWTSDSGTVYVLDGQGGLRAFDEASGRRLWSSTTAFGAPALPPVVRGRVLYYVTRGGDLKVIDLASRVVVASAGLRNRFSSGSVVRELSAQVAHGRLLVGNAEIAVVDDLGIAHVFVDSPVTRANRL